MIDDAILFSGSLAKVSPEAEMFFMRLRLIVDSYGRAQASAMHLTVEAFPRRGDDLEMPRRVAAWMDELIDPERHDDDPPVVVYEAGGVRLLQLTGFEKWNTLRRRGQSKWPGPDGRQGAWVPPDSRTNGAANADRSGTTPGVVLEHSGTTPEKKAIPPFPSLLLPSNRSSSPPFPSGERDPAMVQLAMALAERWKCWRERVDPGARWGRWEMGGNIAAARAFDPLAIDGVQPDELGDALEWAEVARKRSAHRSYDLSTAERTASAYPRIREAMRQERDRPTEGRARGGGKHVEGRQVL